MSAGQRVVADNNILISKLLFPHSIPGQAVYRITHQGQLLLSEAFLAELAAVLIRPKFDRYITLEDRKAFLRGLDSLGERVSITYTVHACRDPKDNMILELAVNGRADLIVTGDADLLSLGKFHGISILSPAAYLAS